MKILSVIITILWILLFGGHCVLAKQKKPSPDWQAFLWNESFIVFFSIINTLDMWF